METKIKYIKESEIHRCRVIDIYGENYMGFIKHFRPASRAVIVTEGKILLSHETKIGQWMIPGGGMEAEESQAECCVRETAEETGLKVEAGNCFLVINEYFEDWQFVNHYFVCDVKGNTERKLTDREMQVGVMPEWILFDEAVELFSRYQEYAGTDEQRRGIYYREYTALMEFQRIRNSQI